MYSLVNLEYRMNIHEVHENKRVAVGKEGSEEVNMFFVQDSSSIVTTLDSFRSSSPRFLLLLSRNFFNAGISQKAYWYFVVRWHLIMTIR